MAAVLLLAILLAGIRMPQNVKAAGNLPGKLFSKPSTEYNNNLAYLSAEFCDNAQGESSTKIESILNEYGIKNKVYNYGESAAFVIGHKEVNIEGEGKANVLVIIARGTETWAEKIGDWQKDNKVVKLWEKGKSAVKSIMKGNEWKEFVNDWHKAGERFFLEEKVYNNVYDFEEKVWKGLNAYLDENPDVENDKNLKILVTGHSLGGAAANMVAARMDYLRNRGEWISTVKKENIYCYTFGAIKVLAHDINIEDGYENIYNIYNKYDSFGPNGNLLLKRLNVSHPKAKFGYTLEYSKLRDSEIVTPWNNHDMGKNYKKAVKKGFVYAVAVKMRLCYPDVKLSNEFKIEGKWKNVGAATFGQVQSGAIVIFNGGNCAIYSPYDTYAFYKEDDQLYLDCTSFLFRDTVQFKVKILDNDNIELNYGSTTLRLKRVN